MESPAERLYYAIHSDDSCAVENLLRDGLPVDCVFDSIYCRSAWSALHLCAEKGRVECARVLLDHKANPNIRDKWGQTPLMYAVVAEWVNMIDLLIRYRVELDARSAHGQTALHLALNCEDNTCLKLLHAAGARLETRDVLGRSPIWKAVSKDGRLIHLKTLISLGSDVNAVDAKDKFTPLQAAVWYAEKDRLEYVKLLLAAGACLSTPHEAAVQRHTCMTSIVQRGWKLGRDITAEEKEIIQSLLLSATSCDIDMVVPKGVYTRVNSIHHPHCGTALMMAAHRGAPTMVSLLLDAGANPDIQDIDGCTALHLAVIFNNLHCIQLLLDASCSLHLKAEVYIDKLLITKSDVTPFHCALLQGHTQAALVIVDAGYDLRYENYIRKCQDLPTELCQGSRFQQLLSVALMKPRKLKNLCRKVIRTQLKHQLWMSLQKLPLPAVLIDYISLSG